MARALLCWELGQNRGHIEPLAQIGRALEQQGHEILYAVRNTHTAALVLDPHHHRWFQAPVPIDRNIRMPHPVNHSELLRNIGYSSSSEITGRLHAWQQLLDETQPDLLITDHAPTALLAGHANRIPRVATGSGFLVPPDEAPWPAFRHWESQAVEKLTAADNELLTIINQACDQLKLPGLPNVQSLYNTASQALLTLPGLDHYPQRPDAHYLGCLPPATGRAAPAWPDTNGKRIFVYLHPFKTLPDLLANLANSGANAIIYLSPAMPELEQRFAQHANLAFVSEPVDLAQTAEQCDLAICNGGHATVTTFLQAGKPLLILPLYLETLLMAQRVEQLGAGLSAPQLTPEGMRAKLQRLLQEDSFTQAAADFAAQNANLSSTDTLDRLLAQIREIA